MARYGNEFYGLTTYGTDTLVDFDVSPFVVSSIDYNKIVVRWNTPTGDWDLIRLVRNGFGFPVTPDDGDLLYQGDNTSDVLDYFDEGQVPNNSGLIEGRTYYYTIFVRESTTGRWISSGNNLGVAVKNYGTAALMYEYLPAIYKITNPYSASDNDSEVNYDLFNFLQIFAFEHDLFKTTTENMKNRYDPLTLDGRLVPSLLKQFGFTYEREIGLQQARVVLKNAIKIYSERGSRSGIKTFVSAFSGFNADISDVVNLMLDYNNSTFKESLGFWEVSGNDATIERATVEDEDPLVPPYFEVGSPSNFPNFTNGFLKLTFLEDGEATLSCGKAAPLTRGIPVAPGTSYVFSCYSRARDTSRDIVTNILWYDRFGSFIGSAGEAIGTIPLEEWGRTGASTGNAPENAYYAIPEVRIEGALDGEIYYIDAAQFEIGSEPTTYADARRIDVILRANRINQVRNPSFEAVLDNWYFENATAEIAADGAVEGSSSSAKLTVATVELTTATSLVDVDVQGGDQNALSAYVKGPAGTIARLSIAWYDQASQLISISTSSNLTLAGLDWERLEYTSLSPQTAVTAQLSVNFEPLAIGDELFIDAVLFEKAAFVVPYFDGSGAGYAQLGDTIWEDGDTVNGRSHYYKNRDIVTKRLFSVLPEYIPSGSPWAVLVAQPD